MPMRVGKGGQRPFALHGEQAFGGKLCAQFLELALERAEARILHVVDDELVFAARLVQPDAGADQHLLAVPGGECAQHIALAEHGAAHLGAGILQRKVPMAGARPGEIGDFRLQP